MTEAELLFQEDLQEKIKAEAKVEGQGQSAALLSVAVEIMKQTDMIPDFIHSFYVGTGKFNAKIRVDGYYHDEVDNTLNLFSASYDEESAVESLKKREIETGFSALERFVIGALNKQLTEIEPSTEVSTLVDMIYLGQKEIKKIRLIFVTNSRVSSSTMFASKKMGPFKVEYLIWDIEHLRQISTSGHKDIDINFKDYYIQGIPCIMATQSSSGTLSYNSYLCVIPGTVLADIYDKYGSALLENNVRSFLSVKREVNKKIQETILTAPSNFFVYNNGIASTARNIQVASTPQGAFIVAAKDFQIVNGGQTTVSLSNCRFKKKADLSKIFVQMKLTDITNEADSEATEEFVHDISRSSNSQTKVSDADFFAFHPFHRRFEEMSRRIFAPAVEGQRFETHWFYERARGQYLQAQMRMTDAAKARFKLLNPREQWMSKLDLAKVWNTWDELPHIVSKGAETHFKAFADKIDERWSLNDTIFNDGYFKESVALMILFKRTEELVSKQLWYRKGYRANIVTYSLALLHKLIKEQFNDNDLDLERIWRLQRMPEAIGKAMVDITKFVFDTINDPSRATINVTQWCKVLRCWENVQKCPIKLEINEFNNLLIGKATYKESVKKEVGKRKIYSDVEAQTIVINKGGAFWCRLRDFLSGMPNLGSPDMSIALNQAVQIPRKVPNSYQAKILIKLIDLAKTEGFIEDAN